MLLDHTQSHKLVDGMIVFLVHLGVCYHSARPSALGLLSFQLSLTADGFPLCDSLWTKCVGVWRYM
jgi:hypothetical protein